ncbi:MAG: hypothetical protein ACKOF9_01435 [Burkholderiales bacterium]
MENVTHFTGAIVISFVIVLNVAAMYLFLSRRFSLDPRSRTNHSISRRFDSVDELREFHVQEEEGVRANAEAALQRYRQAMARELNAMDPSRASSFHVPNKSFNELL